ncbi:MAG: hypothetical protein U0P30_05985 [Vicinamibacterales bacterium]
MRTRDDALLPTIGNGLDVQALVRAMLPHLMAHFESVKGGAASQLNAENINADLAKLPERPDEDLQ